MSFRLAGFADEAANDLEDQIRVLKENHIDLVSLKIHTKNRNFRYKRLRIHIGSEAFLWLHGCHRNIR